MILIGRLPFGPSSHCPDQGQRSISGVDPPVVGPSDAEAYLSFVWTLGGTPIANW